MGQLEAADEIDFNFDTLFLSHNFELLDYILESKLSRVRASRTARTRSFTVLVGSSIRVNVVSQDVIHSFSIPILNVHVDATPRRNSIIKFSPYLVRSATATCQELCRHRHSRITLNLYFY